MDPARGNLFDDLERFVSSHGVQVRLREMDLDKPGEFDGPSITHLMSSNIDGPAGFDPNRIGHTAASGGVRQPIAFTSAFRGNRQLFGANDNGVIGTLTNTQYKLRTRPESLRGAAGRQERLREWFRGRAGGLARVRADLVRTRGVGALGDRTRRGHRALYRLLPGRHRGDDHFPPHGQGAAVAGFLCGVETADCQWGDSDRTVQAETSCPVPACANRKAGGPAGTGLAGQNAL